MNLLSPVTLNAYLLLSGLLFTIGFFGVLLRRNVLIMYMSLELMLTAASMVLVAFSRFNDRMDGVLFVFFVITVAAAEIAVGLALIVALFKRHQTVMVSELNRLKD
jgi:NADH-quinone oxidoreductase subunit K